MRVVIDANVAIAAVAARGLCEAVFELCLEHHTVILCEGILAEIEEKLRKKLKVPSPIIAEFVKTMRDAALIIEPEEVDENACRDPNDLMVLGLLRPGNADAIITGDKDLQVLENFKGASIISPRSFWDSDKDRRLDAGSDQANSYKFNS